MARPMIAACVPGVLFPVKKPSLKTLVCLAPLVLLVCTIGNSYLSSMNSTAAFPNGYVITAEHVLDQDERHLILEEGCNATMWLRPNRSLDYLISHPRLLDHIIVNDDHKLLYCYIPKVASTQWKKLLGVLSGTLPNVPLQEIPGYRAHESGVHRFLHRYGAGAIRRRLAAYRSFLFVRHPLERLVSGYVNKFASAGRDSYFPRRFAGEILRRAGRGDTGRRNASVAFDDFVRWVVDPPAGSIGARNEHWRPMVELCHPCALRYTLVGRMEWLSEDARHVLRLANITELAFPDGRRPSSRGAVSEMLMRLDPALLRKVFRLYLQDFAVFGYDPSEVFASNKTAYLSSKAMFKSLFVKRRRS